MEDRSQIKIVPTFVSDLRNNGRRVWFTVVGNDDAKYTCFNTRLRDSFAEGEELEVVVECDGTFVRIVGVVGFADDQLMREEKAPKNEAEARLYELMRSEGWEVTKRGWPDFACFKDGKVILVEVKPKRSHRLKFWQHRLLTELVKKGVECYRWNPSEGFVPIQGPTSLPTSREPEQKDQSTMEQYLGLVSSRVREASEKGDREEVERLLVLCAETCLDKSAEISKDIE